MAASSTSGRSDEAFGAHLLTTEELEVVRDVAGALVIHSLQNTPDEAQLARLVRAFEMPEGKLIDAKRDAIEAIGRDSLAPLSPGVRSAFAEICARKGDVAFGVMVDLVAQAIKADFAFKEAMRGGSKQSDSK